MNAMDERSVSIWMATARMPEALPLASDLRTDVVVVGGGIAGLSTAYELVKAGKAVALLEAGALGGGMTARTTAHLTSESDDTYAELIRVRGLEAAQHYHESHAAAIDRIEAIQAEAGIDCGFRRLDGYLFRAEGTPEDELERELEAARKAGLAGVGWAARAPLTGLDTGRALRFPGQGRFHPLAYLAGLVDGIRREGGQLFAQTRAVEVRDDKGTVVVRTAGGQVVRAGAAVVATNGPINDRVAIHSKQAPYRTYVIGARVPKGEVEDALYWDTAEPYHYVRLQPETDHDVLIVGGEDHKTGHEVEAEARFERLAAWTRARFPAMQEVIYRWSGQVMEPADRVAFIGRSTSHGEIFVVSGDSGEGVTHGVVASLLLRDLVLGKENAWATLYDPKRKPVKAAKTFLKENLGVAARLTEYVTGGDLRAPEQLAPGQGAVIRRGAMKVAAYRDEAGKLHARSAICTHAGCIVHWNALERCWDCPCHGSQFGIDGTPLNGPATTPLATVALDHGHGGERAAE